MTNIDHGITGVKQASVLKDGNARHLLAKTLEKNPNIGDADLLETIIESALKDRDILEAIVVNWIARERANLTRRPYSPRSPSPQQKKAKEQAEENAAEMVKEFKTDVFRSKFLDMMVPGLDKPVRECTVAEMGTVIGAFSMFANCGEPHQKIGELFTDEEAQKLYDQGLNR